MPDVSLRVLFFAAEPLFLLFSRRTCHLQIASGTFTLELYANAQLVQSRELTRNDFVPLLSGGGLL
ncbi:hypothetical protein GCM10020370_26340 [Paenibacillus hodogayensis]